MNYSSDKLYNTLSHGIKMLAQTSQVDQISLLNDLMLLYDKSLERDLLDKQLGQLKESFYNFFNIIQDLLLVIDLNGKIVDINNSVLHRLNYSREELLGKPISMLHPQDQLEEIQEKFRDVIKGHKKHLTLSAITKEGHIFPVESTNREGLWEGKPVIFAVVKDLSDLSMSEEKFSKAFHDSGVSMFISRFEDGRFLDVNDTFLNFIGYSREEVIGQTTLELQMTNEYNSREFIKDKIETYQKISDLEMRFITKDNATRIGLVHIVPLSINHEKCLLSSIIDITDRVKNEQKILEMSNRDSLTGVYNRHCIYQWVKEIISKHKKKFNNFSVAIIDIDNFKNVNDTYGHQVGDYVLKEFAKIINDNLRLEDLLGRYGGEEFIIVLDNSNRSAGSIILERILNIVRKTAFVYNDHHIQLTFSGGISCCLELDQEQISIDRLVEIADQRMYTAKRNGKNRIVYND